jgi:hypothetical protein
MPKELFTEGAHMTETAIATRASTEQRRSVLASNIAQQVRKGWSVESQTDYQATLAKGHRPNHVLHLILTVLTIGIWGIVWIIVSLTSRVKRQTITVDEFGNVMR